jgi:hypothetical protein
MVWTATGCAAVETRVRVPAAKQDLPAGPVWLAMPADTKLPAGPIVAMDAATKTPVPAQAGENGRLCVWSGPRKAGAAWDLLVAGPDKTAKDRVFVDATRPGEATVTLDGKPFTAYHYTDKFFQPFLYPVVGPTGDDVTRHYPIRTDVPDEEKDHPHHHSLWTAHGDVNGINHWNFNNDENQGFKKHRRFVRTTNGPVFGQIVAMIDWTKKNGERQLTEQRTYTFYAGTDDARWIDVQVKFDFADGDVKFGDTKEGGLVALRVACSMIEKKGGTIQNAAGAKGMKGCWGKESPWCDYYGPVKGKTVGISIMDCPTNFRHPTPYHVRDYGLYTANPFGLSMFRNSKEVDGSKTWRKGETAVFNYRLFFHKGSTEEAGVAGQYALYTADFDGAH